jgi:hypothetical protein
VGIGGQTRKGWGWEVGEGKGGGDKSQHTLQIHDSRSTEDMG